MKNNLRFQHHSHSKLCFAILVLLLSSNARLPAQDLVNSITKGPITPDGNVAGSRTGLLINFDGSFDPAVEGRSLLKGHTISFELPEGFVDTGAVPVADAFSSPTCSPNNFQCSTVVMLQGWPQHPILPSVPQDEGPRTPQYSLEHEPSTNTFTITADVDITPGLAVPGPGIKGLVLVLNGFENPEAGTYEIPVMAETGPDGALETGIGQVTVLPEIESSIHVSSQFNAGTPNTIYQTARPGQRTPLPYDFLLWGSDGSPMLDVQITATDDPASSLLTQNGQQVGTVSINAPDGATGFGILTETASSVVQSVNPDDAGRLTALFQAGDMPGNYDVTFALGDGSLSQMSATMFVDVVPEPSCSMLALIALGATFLIRQKR